MTMTEILPTVEVTPAVERFAFSVQKPQDWQQMPIPADETDFDNPTLFMPLALFMPAWGAVVFTVAARPAYGEGTLADWLMYLCREQELRITEFMPAAIGNTFAASCVCSQDSEAGEMKVRIALFEDGGALLSLIGMAPVAIWDSVAALFDQMITSFRLAAPQGSSVPLANW